VSARSVESGMGSVWEDLEGVFIGMCGASVSVRIESSLICFINSRFFFGDIVCLCVVALSV